MWVKLFEISGIETISWDKANNQKRKQKRPKNEVPRGKYTPNVVVCLQNGEWWGGIDLYDWNSV